MVHFYTEAEPMPYRPTERTEAQARGDPRADRRRPRAS